MGSVASVEEDEDSGRKWHLEPKPAYETQSWTLHAGTDGEGHEVSAFRSHNGELNCTTLEYSAKTLRVLRHPCILRHVHSRMLWEEEYRLITEAVTPLEILLQREKLKTVEIAAGLYNVICALEFLHDTCNIRHNNVDSSSVFVTVDGNWKLGGFEAAEKYLPRSNDKVTGRNYETLEYLHADDMKAFGALALHLLNLEDVTENQVGNPVVMKFKKRIEAECLHSDPCKIPKSKALRQDEFFGGDFIGMKVCLQNIVLKPPEEKEQFFQSLPNILNRLDLHVLASQILPLLMSRFVFLNPTARKCVLPLLLRPKTEYSPHCLLPADVFKEFMIPQLKKVFQVHDVCVRLQILENFSHFVYLFSNEDLQDVVLPEVLFGIRDVNDELVAASLNALAILVKILGVKVVIGENSQRFFTENSPGEVDKQPSSEKHSAPRPPDLIDESSESTFLPKDALPKVDVKRENLYNKRNDFAPYCSLPAIPERSSPDGGESLEDEKWADWDEETDGKAGVKESTPTSVVDVVSDEVKLSVDAVVEKTQQSKKVSSSAQVARLGEEFDIMALDIKTTPTDDGEEDFFADMQPKIMLPKPYGLSLDERHESHHRKSSMLDVPLDIEDEECCGWDDSELEIEW